jgi:hypothetical protein
MFYYFVICRIHTQRISLQNAYIRKNPNTKISKILNKYIEIHIHICTYIYTHYVCDSRINHFKECENKTHTFEGT